MPSLIIETAKTKSNGVQAVNGFKGDIEGIEERIAIKIKYRLAYFLS